jgi:uncharacterized protein (DUF2249 family)
MNVNQKSPSSSPSCRAVQIDVRGLPPPEPMQHIMDALDLLARGDVLHVAMDREPHPLFGILERDGYTHHGEWTGNGYALRIWHAAA